MHHKPLIDNIFSTFLPEKEHHSGYEGRSECSGYEGHTLFNPLINGVLGRPHTYRLGNSGYEGHPFGLRRTVIRVMRDTTPCNSSPIKGWMHIYRF